MTLQNLQVYFTVVSRNFQPWIIVLENASAWEFLSSVLSLFASLNFFFYCSTSMHKLTNLFYSGGVLCLLVGKLLLDDGAVFWILSFFGLGRIGSLRKERLDYSQKTSKDRKESVLLLLSDQLFLTHTSIINWNHFTETSITPALI